MIVQSPINVGKQVQNSATLKIKQYTGGLRLKSPQFLHFPQKFYPQIFFSKVSKAKNVIFKFLKFD